MLKNNKDYKALTSLKEHINEVNRLEKTVQEKKQRIKDMQDVSYDYTNEGYPYHDILSQLEEIGQRFSFGLKLLWVLIVFTLIAFIAGILLGTSYYLNRFNILPEGALQRGVYIISVALTVILSTVFIILFKSKIKQKLLTMRYHHKVKRQQKNLEEAKNQSLKMIEEEKKQLSKEINVLQKELKEDEINLQGHHNKIEASITIPKQFLQHVDKILTYFEAYRAETIKEAINLYNEDEREKLFLKRLLYGIRMPEIPIDDILSDDFDPQTMQEKTNTVEEIAEESPTINLMTEKKTKTELKAIKEKDKLHAKKREKLGKIKRRDIEDIKDEDLDYDIPTVGKAAADVLETKKDKKNDEVVSPPPKPTDEPIEEAASDKATADTVEKPKETPKKAPKKTSTSKKTKQSTEEENK